MSKFLTGFFTAAFIWYFAQQFNKSSLDESIIVIIAIGAGCLYYPLKRRIKIGNESGKILVTFVILFVTSAVLVGAFTTIG